VVIFDQLVQVLPLEDVRTASDIDVPLGIDAFHATVFHVEPEPASSVLLVNVPLLTNGGVTWALSRRSVPLPLLTI